MRTLRSVPEQGQLAEVRRRRYVVSDVRRSAAPQAAMGAVLPQHLVSLVSVEDDALGEELQVIWELEPAARAFDKIELPTPNGFDTPARLDAFLDAVRWGASSVADTKLIQAPFYSGIEIEPYQLDPVVRAVQMPRVSLLVADDVGLGKTIEAGLVIRELMLRHRARRILVVCPATLQIKWQSEMSEKFGLEFEIVDTPLIKRLRRERGLHANPWTHFPRLITSMDYLKRETPLRLFREAVARTDKVAGPREFDILIVDEAHNAAPSASGTYALDSQRTQAVREIGSHFEHKLFLTATPHNGYRESFSALLELLDNQRFARAVTPDPVQLRAIMVRRLKSEIKDWAGDHQFPPRELYPIEVKYSDEEKRVHALLAEYVELRSGAYRDNAEKFATEFVLKLLKKRLFSSPQAFLTTLGKHRETLRRSARTQSPQPAQRFLAQVFDRAEEDFSSDDEQTEAAQEALEAAAKAFRPVSAVETAILDELQKWAERASATLDSKAQELLAWIDTNLRNNGQWNDERVIIFTEYRDTQKWLHGMLAARQLAGGGRVELLHGAQDSEERERIKAAFQYDPKEAPVRILLATDSASEGIDLQRQCHQLIHYEIPWNPNRLEQRNGRIDRHGQRADKVLVYHFVASGYRDGAAATEDSGSSLAADLEFLFRAAKKVQQIREDLGKVGPVIAQQVEEAMLGKRRVLDTGRAERDNEPVKRLLRFEQNVREQTERLKKQHEETRRELHLTPANIESVVHIALDLARQPKLIPTKVEGVTRAYHLPYFVDPSWQKCRIGLEHPHTRTVRAITFDPDEAKGRDDIVLAHLNHRLVERCLRLLRAEVWAPEDRQSIHRVTARLVPSSALQTPAVLAHARLTVVSSDSQRLHEELIAAGGVLVDGKLERLNVSQTADLLAAQTDREAPETIRTRMVSLWPQLLKPLQSVLNARAKDKTESIQRQLAERGDSEVKKVEVILADLERSIRAELNDPRQLELFGTYTEMEREQAKRNHEFLADRLNQIPADLAREIETIRKRYADPEPRLFPVAVTFLVPEGLK
ncbi:MAG: DISARM system SNF2-like helicase DrmD [Bryobacteraceae bacterium]